MELTDLGWNDFFARHFEQYGLLGYSPLRIVRENREQYAAVSPAGRFSCEVTGKFRFEHERKSSFPTVGDWVAASVVPQEQKAMIHAVLPRKSVFSRKAAGEITEAQPAAANIDTVFIVTGLDLNYSVRRIERYLALAWDSGAVPVLILNKTDVCPESEQRKREVESAAPGVDVYALSACERTGMDDLNKYLTAGSTVAFLGSSGVGKSTIINTLIGSDRLAVHEVSDTGSLGGHTTTFRELILLDGGGMVIDTPGMRELQVWGDDAGLEQVFDDIRELAESCRFKDCRHENEPGCAVLAAVSEGSLDEKRFNNYVKLKKEFAYLAERQAMSANAVEKLRRKGISKEIKRLYKDKNRWD